MADKDILIRKLYAGTCSREELVRLFDLIRDAPEADYEEVMSELWHQLKHTPEIEETTTTEMRRQLLSAISTSEPSSQLNVSWKTNRTKVSNHRARLRQIVSFAAASMLVGVLCWLWLDTEQLITTQTAFAEQKTIVLPDQSTVKLNANSSVKFQKKWDSEDTRKVWLEGEAYFEVRKNRMTRQKFQVITNDLTVEVLGTVFNVNARETSTKVFLEEGQVGLDLKVQSEPILMKPGELVTYTKSSGKSSKQRIENEVATSWKDGTVIMEDALLRDIIQKIHEIYDVTVVVEEPKHLDREFSIFLPVDKPRMGFSMLAGLGLDIERTDKKWKIK